MVSFGMFPVFVCFPLVSMKTVYESVRAPDAVGRSWCRPHGRAAAWLGIGVCGRRDTQGSRGSMMVAFGRGKNCYVNEFQCSFF